MDELDCLCSGRYISELKKKVLTRCIEHQQDSIKVTGSHLVPLITLKRAIDDSTGFTLEQLPNHRNAKHLYKKGV